MIIDPDPAEFAISQDQIDSICLGKLHPLALTGIFLFNQREYFQAHEALEEAWRAEQTPLRELYRGILQVGLAYYKIQLGKYDGAIKLFTRSRFWLEPFPDWCRGVNVTRLKQDAHQAETYLTRLGPQHIHEYDYHYFLPIEIT